ncbi:MAG: hypothetical protein KGL43_08460 [Burkholderiales bacterium]|nr:hypothetical protein [Burkholderiales bacterium]MDE2397499.1 hypothetical protein [Burkholderiales bacterium]MDE2453613.1 hypothetical protein [Burkholderiales bacterium]
MTTEAESFAESMAPGFINAHTRSSLALTIWREQIALGLGDPGEIADEARLDGWLANRTYPLTMLDDAIGGDAAAVVYIRAEAGLPILR